MNANDSDAEFRAWLISAQGLSIEALDAEASEQFRRIFELGKERHSAWKAQPAPSRLVSHRDHRYAVAILDGDELGLTFWIRRSQKGEIFLLYPRDSDMDPHASYHLNGRYHQKSYQQIVNPQSRQPLSGNFTNAEHLGTFSGHGAGPRIKDRSFFDDILVVQTGILGGLTGKIAVDLVAPGVAPAAHHRAQLEVVEERIYKDATPWIVVAVCR